MTTEETTTPAEESGPDNSAGVAALVLGIVSIVAALNGWWLFLIPIAIATGILAIVFGRRGRKRADEGSATNRGQATAGFVLGTVTLSLVALTAIGFFAFGGWDGRDGEWKDDDSFSECIDDADGVADLRLCIESFPEDAAELELGARG